MPIILLFVGGVFIVTGLRGSQNQLFTQVQKDFTGAGNFWYWIAGIGAVGAIGYYSPLRTISNALLILIIVVIFLANKGGFFSQFTASLSQIQAPPAQTEATAGQTETDTNIDANLNSTSGSASNPLSNVGNIGEDVTEALSLF